MKRFNYRAKEKETGKTIKGNIQAENERTAGRLLVEQGYIPQTITEEGTGLLNKANRVTAKDRIMFTRQLATLIGAGLPLASSLRTVTDQTQSKAMKPSSKKSSPPSNLVKASTTPLLCTKISSMAFTSPLSKPAKCLVLSTSP